MAAKTLTMMQVGFLSAITEFVGAVGLGARVTGTIKNGIISIDRFREPGVHPGTLMLSMGCAEVGSAAWLMFATRLVRPSRRSTVDQTNAFHRECRCLPPRRLLVP